LLTYLIDGNNLIGKISSLMNLQKKDKQASREKLSYILDRYFQSKKSKTNLFYDGFENGKINAANLKIIYSDNQTADDKIKSFISDSKSQRNIVLITSDSNLAQFARKCSCTIISSDSFAADIFLKGGSENDDKPNANDNVEEYKKLFGIK
jgi:predicted RNA-binding protein with PIN domain